MKMYKISSYNQDTISNNDTPVKEALMTDSTTSELPHLILTVFVVWLVDFFGHNWPIMIDCPEGRYLLINMWHLESCLRGILHLCDPFELTVEVVNVDLQIRPYMLQLPVSCDFGLHPPWGALQGLLEHWVVGSSPWHELGKLGLDGADNIFMSVMGSVYILEMKEVLPLMVSLGSPATQPSGSFLT